MSFGLILLLTREVASAHQLRFLSFWLLIYEKRGLSSSGLQASFQHEHPVIRFHSFADFLLTLGSRASPSSQRERNTDCPPASLCSGPRFYWEADDGQKSRAGPAPYISSTHWEAADGNVGDLVCSAQPCRTNKQHPAQGDGPLSASVVLLICRLIFLAESKDPISELNRV